MDIPDALGVVDRAPSLDAPKDLPIQVPINFLIVDDEAKNLTVLETVLEDPGYRLVRAESAEKALLALVNEEFALIILDIHMPGMTGFELAKMVKDRKKTAQVPIIFLTAYFNEDQHVLAGYDMGAVDYLHKPVNPDILRSKVAVFAELYRKKREIEDANRTLTTQATERRRIEDQLRELNESLEQRVSERTEALREADRRKDEFIATLAHELRNPLAPLRNALAILNLTGNDNASVRSASAIMDRQVSHMVRLVDDLLDVSRVSRGTIVLRRERIDLVSIVQECIDNVRPQCEARSQQLEVQLPPDSIYLDADPVRLVQVLGNLLNNASKFTDNGGRIWLSVSVEPRPALLRREASLEAQDKYLGLASCVAAVRIRDSGIGLAPDRISQIFEMFVQVDNSLERSRGGLGIGLTIVKNLLELHGGDVEVHSEGIGHGSEFVVSLPIPAPISGTRTIESPLAESRAQTARRILVVDDNVDAAKTLAMVLELAGHEIHTANDGLKAIEAAEMYKPDVVFLDIGLPKLNGYEVATKIREQEWGQTMMLVALTGWGQEEDRRRSSEAGFDHHLVKPVKLNDLSDLLKATTPIRS